MSFDYGIISVVKSSVNLSNAQNRIYYEDNKMLLNIIGTRFIDKLLKRFLLSLKLLKIFDFLNCH